LLSSVNLSKRNPDLSDIEVGDEVELRLKNGDVTRIEIISGGSEFVIGELYRVDTDNRRIRVEDRDGDRTTYEVASEADIEVPGNSQAELKDLETGKPVKLIIEDDEVTDIVQGKMREGTIRSVSASDDTVEFERSGGSTAAYEVNNDVIIEYDNRSLDLDDLKNGDEAQLYIFDDEVYLIVVTKRG